MKTLFTLIVLIALAAGAYWYFGNERNKEQVRHAQEEASARAAQMKDSVKERLKEFSLNTPEIKDELERTGKVVRKKAEQVGNAIADATADTRITATVKAKLIKDPSLSALRISVSTTDGVVTLSGSVNSTEEIGQAMRLALETDGVREAISTLQVKTSKP